MFLKLKNTDVLYFNLEDFVVEIIREDLLPFGLRGMLTDKRDTRSILSNIEALKEWLSSRVLSLSRDNAKDIFTLFSIEQNNTLSNRVEVCLKCKALSIQDSYWVGEEGENWEDFNIRKNRFTEIIDVALYGEHPSITTDPVNPELTTKGLFRKAWIRKKDKLILLKSDKTSDFVNTRMELLSSDLLDYFYVDGKKLRKVDYWNKNFNGLTVACCENFVGEEYSFVEARFVKQYCNKMGFEFIKYCEKFGSEFFAVPLVDYIIMNTDRHSENYGFLMNNDTGELERIAPLFDHNLSLVSDYFGKNAEDSLSQMIDGYSIIGLAQEFVNDYGSGYLILDIDGLEQFGREIGYEKIVDNVIRRYKKLKSWSGLKSTKLFNEI